MTFAVSSSSSSSGGSSNYGNDSGSSSISLSVPLRGAKVQQLQQQHHYNNRSDVCSSSNNSSSGSSSVAACCLGAAAGPVGSLSGETVSEGGSADSLFIRDIHERRELKRQELEGGDSDSGNDGGGGLLHDLLKHFRHCCASRRKGRFAPANAASAAAAGPAAAANGLAAAAAAVKGRPHRARTYSASGSGSSSSSSSSSTDARSAVADKYIADKAHLVSWRVVLGQQGPAGARWVGEEGGFGGGASGAAFYNMTPAQAAWAACSWCVRLENNEKMTGRLIEDLIDEGFAQKAAVDVLHAVKETTRFGNLEFVRRVDGVEAEDVLGDFNGLYDQEVRPENQTAAGAAVYAVLQAARVVGLFVRRHGELIECSAFNVIPTEKERFPPSVIGFNSIEDMEEYVLELYKRDPRMKRAGGGVSALLFKSRSLHKIAPGRSDYTAARETQGDRLAQLQALREKDPKYDAKLLYTNMYKATTQDRADTEVFAMEQGVGMEIREREALQQTQKFMSPDEAVSMRGNAAELSVHLRVIRSYPSPRVSSLSSAVSQKDEK
ncbi:hypothetical protein Emed_005160 [Eimeria media]